MWIMLMLQYLFHDNTTLFMVEPLLTTITNEATMEILGDFDKKTYP
jgi:hypothetical protein